MEGCSDTNCCGAGSDDDGCSGFVSPLEMVFSVVCALVMVKSSGSMTCPTLISA